MNAIRIVLPLFLFLSAVSAQAATWTTIDVPGSKDGQAFGINNAGDIVGYYNDGVKYLHGYLLRGGNFTTIVPPGGGGSLATGVNDAGYIVGYFEFVNDPARTHGFLFDGTNYTVLDFPGSNGSTIAWGINNAGEVVGFYYDGQTNHGFRWSNGVYTTVDPPDSPFTQLYGINNFGQIVGWYEAPMEIQSFVLNAHEAFRYFGSYGQAASINDHRVVVGYSPGFKFNLKTKAYVPLQFPDALDTGCWGINNDGTIVGNYVDASGTLHGFLRTK